MRGASPWLKAAKSTANGNCVEVRKRAGMIEVRDTKQGGRGPRLRFTPAEFDAFLDGACNREFDHLLGD